MAKEKEPGVRLCILDANGEVDENLTEALEKIVPKGKKLSIELSAGLAVKIATAAAKQFEFPVDEVTIETDVSAINPINSGDTTSRKKCAITMVPT